MQAFWARVQIRAAELDPQAAAYDSEMRKHNPNHKHSFVEKSTKVVWVTSEKQPTKGIRSGRVFQAPPFLAAKLMVEGTHRASTQVEIEGWQKEQGQRVSEAQALAASKLPPAPQINVHLPPESLNRDRRTVDSSKS